MNLPHCILCSSTKKRNLYTINKYTVVSCDNCSLIFIVPWPSKKELEKLYGNYTFETGFLMEHLIRTDAKRTLKIIKKLGYKNSALLDIGCGAGFLLDEARKNGFDTIGVDTGKVAIDYAKKELKLNVMRKDFHEFTTKKKFQIITLIQVIEHITNPYPMLNKTKSLLDTNGIVCIATPNIDSWLYRVLKKRFNYLIPPEHVIYYSPKTLKLLLEKVGFTVIKTITYGYPEDVGAIYRFLRERSKLERKQILHKNPKTVSKEVLNKNNIKLLKLKQFKHYLFEDVIRNLAYPLLNLGLNGSMIEIYAKKKEQQS